MVSNFGFGQNKRIQNYLQSKKHSKGSHTSFWVGGTVQTKNMRKTGFGLTEVPGISLGGQLSLFKHQMTCSTRTVFSSSNMNLGDELPVLALALSFGGLVIVSVLLVVACAAWRCSKKKKELVGKDVEENPVYGVYELEEGDERRNSVHEIVDQNVFYGQ